MHELVLPSFQLPLTTDAQSGELRRHGLKVTLPDQSFQILRLLLDRPDHVVTREELRQRLWASGRVALKRPSPTPSARSDWTRSRLMHVSMWQSSIERRASTSARSRNCGAPWRLLLINGVDTSNWA